MSKVCLTIALAALCCACGTQSTPTGCFDAPLAEQGLRRVVVGSTVYLPQRAEDADGACSTVTWRVTEAPEGSENAVVDGADGFGRFTADAAGDYVFAADGEDPIEMTVVERAPFTNHNLYPTNGAAVHGGSLWVASVLTPHVLQLDPQSLAVQAEIPVGDWPVAVAASEARDEVLVAQRGADTLGVLDAASGRLVDAVWVGDEPASVVVSPDGGTAYVALPTEGMVAVVDLETRAVTERWTAMADANTLALTPDGSTLLVAPRRSGQPERPPYAADPVDAERDVVALSTEDGSEVRVWTDVASTIGQLAVSADGSRVYATRLINDTAVSLADENAPSFVYELVAWSLADGAEVGAVNLSAIESPWVGASGIVEAGGAVWVAIEGNDVLLRIDANAFEVLEVVDAPGRPRAITAADGSVFAWGHQGRSVTAVPEAGGAPRSQVVTTDPRSSEVATGQAFFTGAGRDFGRFWSCNGCHADGLTDTLVWNAGPLEDRVVSRPFSWLEGTEPLGWAGYLSSVENYAYSVTTNVGIRVVTDEAVTLGAYLGSLMPPAPANHLTQRDGSLSAEAEAGRAQFEASCASCHPLPLTTSRVVLGTGVTEGVTDIPALVGAYRYGTWMKFGDSTSLDGAVDLTAQAFGTTLEPEAAASLTRFVAELTGRDFFVLRTRPAPELPVPVDATFRVDFSMPLWDDADNLAAITLTDAGGTAVPVQFAVDGRHLEVTPTAPLQPDTAYTLSFGEALESFSETSLFATQDLAFTTAAAPSVVLAGSVMLEVDTPSLDIVGGQWDTENTTLVRLPVEATAGASGATLAIDLGQELVITRDAVQSGDALMLPPFEVPVGPSLAHFVPDETTFAGDEDLLAEGTGTFSGPGFSIPDVTWRMVPPIEVGECNEEETGTVPLTLAVDGDDALTFGWEAEEDAIALWVTEPEAMTPFGPGAVMGGDTFWSLASQNAPSEGFAQLVTYGVLPEGADETTETNGGPFQ
ncbi:MAG: Ig-like domain-containing protein, partial [Myxococcota bacterium]